MSFNVGTGPAQARENYAQARPATRKIMIYQPGPARACTFQARTRPGPQNIIEARPGPWAAGRTLVYTARLLYEAVYNEPDGWILGKRQHRVFAIN